MTRNLKALGLALFAAFALCAVVASAASAQNGRLTSTGPVTLIGTETGGAEANQLSAFGFKTSCHLEAISAAEKATVSPHKKTTYTGHKYNVTPHVAIPSGAETITITPHYVGCTTSGFPTTVNMNGCDYVFHLTPTSGVDKYAVDATVDCPTGQHIEITVYANAAEHTANKPFCHVKILEKEGAFPGDTYTGLSATDNTNGTGTISGEVTGITAEKTSTSILCGSSEENATGSLKQDVLIEGRNAENKATSISLSHL